MFDNLDNSKSSTNSSTEKNKGIDWKKELLSWKGGVAAGLLLILLFFLFRGSNNQDQSKITYNSGNRPVGVSNSLNQQAVQRLGVDLTDNLDPKLVPTLVAEAVKEIANKNTSEADFVPALVNSISNKIQSISTIDLNADGLTDPVMVIPTSASSDQEFLLFSIRVPDPAEVTELPSATDQAAWRDIAENKSIEIMTASASKDSSNNLTMQSTPNPQVYGTPSGASPYYHYSPPGLGSILLTSMMMSYLFSPPYMGYGGWGYGGPGPASVTTVTQQRGAVTSGLQGANPSQTAAVNNKGKGVGQSNFKKIPPKSLNQMKTSSFRAKNNSATRTGGFGKNKATSKASKPTASASQPKAQQRSAAKRSSGFGSKRKSGFGKRRR